VARLLLMTLLNLKLYAEATRCWARLPEVIGSVHEHTATKSTDFELFADGCRFTDDTVWQWRCQTVS
jgi:hypothetical protein